MNKRINNSNPSDGQFTVFLYEYVGFFWNLTGFSSVLGIHTPENLAFGKAKPADIKPSVLKSCVKIWKQPQHRICEIFSANRHVTLCEGVPAGFTGVYKLSAYSDDWWSVERNRWSVAFEIFLDSFMQKCEIKKVYWCEAWPCKEHEARWCINCRSDLLQVNLLTQNSSVGRWIGFDLNSWLRFWQTHQHCDQACPNTYHVVCTS